MFRGKRCFLLIAALLGLIILAAPVCVWAAEEAELLATIQNKDAPLFDRMYACKQLGTAGSEAAVPVLAALLDDDQFAHYARYGLEPIPSPKVDDALLGALATLKGDHLVGVIYSLANRGQPAAIGALAEKLGDADEAVATAAAHSIARLGTADAAAVLGEVMSPKFAAAGLVCGKTLAEQGLKDAAAGMLVTVSEMEAAPKHVRQAAMLQAVDLLQADGVEMLAKALASADKSEFHTALRAARLLSPADAAKAAEGAIADAAPAQAALLVTLLGDAGQASTLPTVVSAAGSGDVAVRAAAVTALATLGNAEHVGLLMKAAGDESAEVVTAAQATLATLGADGVDDAVLAALGTTDNQPLVIQLIGRRKITAAVPKLLAMVDGPDQLAVVTALGETISLDKLDVLGKLLGSDSAEVREAVQKAMHAACYRQPDRDATAMALASYLQNAPEETVAFIMNELCVISGPKALALVTDAAQGEDDLLKDYATRALGEWLDTTAAPALLALAKSDPTGKYGVRGVKGYIRLARQFTMDEDQRAAMCRTIIESDARDSEKALVFEVLDRYPSLEMLKVAVQAAKIAGLKADATKSARGIARKLGNDSDEVQALLRQLK